MRGQTGQRVARIIGGRDEPVLSALEEEDPIGQDAARLHHLAEPRRDVAQILSDDGGLVLPGRLGQGGQHVLQRIAGIGAVGGPSPLRHQEQLPQTHRMIDAQRARLLCRMPDQVAERRRPRRGHGNRRQGRQTPVLPLFVEVIRRRADAHVGQHDVAAPTAGPVRGLSDREVQIEADRHAQIATAVAQSLQLQLAQILQPHVKGDVVGAVRCQLAHGITVDIAPRVGPAEPTGTVARIDHRRRRDLEQGMAAQIVAALGHEIVRQGRARGPDGAQGGQLGRSDGGVFDQLRVAQILQHRPVGHVGAKARDLVNGQVQRVQEPPVGRRERAAP